MAIIENKSTENGDVLVIKTSVPIIGLISLLNFVDETEGEGEAVYFEKKFRYSLDGLNWSPLVELTVENVQSVSVESTNTFIIEYYYKHTNPGELFFNNVTLFGEFIQKNCNQAFSDSLFGEYLKNCDGVCMLGWALNVLEKLYTKLYIPEFLTRGKNSSSYEDKDFIDFWYSITHYFAYYVCLARYYAQFQADENLLKEFLNQRSLYFCESSVTYSELIYLSQNYFDEIRKRGTIQIIRKKSEGAFLNGELLRLLCYEDSNEFIFGLMKKEHSSWFVDKSSPCYRGLTMDMSVNKAWEDFTTDLSKYPLINETDLSIINIDNEDCLKINASVSGSGVGGIDVVKGIRVHHCLGYEITFWLMKDDDRNEFEFSCKMFDISGNEITPKDVSLNYTSNIFTITKLNRDDKFYFVRGIIYPYLLPQDYVEETNLNLGKNLLFSSFAVKKIIPQFILKGSNSGSAYIKNINIKPLYTNYSYCLVENSDFLNLWCVNNNTTLSDDEVNKIIEKYILPYRLRNKMNFLKNCVTY